jgi:hypothetical protein
LFADEYKREIPRFFLAHPEYPLKMSLGMPKENYELRIGSKKDKHTYDLFYAYRNKMSQWTSYQLTSSVYR